MGPSNPEGAGSQLRPALDGDFQTLGLVVLVAVALTSPVWLARLHPQNREHVYRSMRVDDGGFSFVEHEIYDVKDDVDIVFAGPSTVWTGIDSPMVEQALTEKLGRPARVLTFGSAGASTDVQYLQIRDALERKRIGMVVTSVPRAPFTDNPSPAGFRFLTYTDPPETIGLPARYRAMLYAGYVLRGPHDMLDWLRPARDVPSPQASTNGCVRALAGWYDQPYVRVTQSSPQLSPEELIYSPRTQSNFGYSGDSLPPYQMYYLTKLYELLKARKVRLVFVSIPMYHERRRSTALERVDWPAMLGAPSTMIGVPPTTLFGNLSDERIQKLFFNDLHLNRNGSEMFTRTITPALVELYANRSRVD
jgi:hypothetical protein